MKESRELIVTDSNVTVVAKALASATRWQILKLLKNQKLDVSQIAEMLGQTEANISAQVKILEKANLIKSKYEPGAHGVKKVCIPSVEKLIIKIL